MIARDIFNNKMHIKIMNKLTISIIWFRQDLRLADNPALQDACKKFPLLAIVSATKNQITTQGLSSNWWHYHTLKDLNQSLDNKLNFYNLDPIKIIQQLMHTYTIAQVSWNSVFEPAAILQERELIVQLEKMNIAYKFYSSNMLWDPKTVLKDDGTAYKVFTPFYRNGCLSQATPRKPTQQPDTMILIKDDQNQTTLDDLFADVTINQRTYLEKIWQPTEKAAHQKLDIFIKNHIQGYEHNRDFPAMQGSSQLSAYLHFGQLSPAQVWFAVATSKALNNDIDCFLKQLGWREFSYNLLYHNPQLDTKNYLTKFDNFPWIQPDIKILQAWQSGQTGYPIIDAGMRELATTGYMHNRVRMLVASFLVKNLMIDWRYGKDWFWQHLVDADLANNSASWQWVAGSGADAAPYFRIFNPILQSKKFDIDGTYIKKFIPEVAKLPAKYIHQPWLAPAHILQQAGIILGKNYPHPIIDITSSYHRAMQAYKQL